MALISASILASFVQQKAVHASSLYPIHSHVLAECHHSTASCIVLFSINPSVLIWKNSASICPWLISVLPRSFLQVMFCWLHFRSSMVPQNLTCAYLASGVWPNCRRQHRPCENLEHAYMLPSTILLSCLSPHVIFRPVSNRPAGINQS